MSNQLIPFFFLALLPGCDRADAVSRTDDVPPSVLDAEARLSRFALLEASGKRLTMDEMMLARLPDQDAIEDPSRRDRRTIATRIKSRIPAERRALYGDLVAWTDTYVRLNPKRLKGDDTAFRPEGFWLTVDSKGKTTRVPIEDVRVLPGNSPDPLFPGTPGYAKGVPAYYWKNVW